MASSNANRESSLTVSLREKDNQIKLLIKERDEQRLQAEVMSKRAEQWEEKFVQSELEKSHVTSEADDEVIELRRLTQELEDENKLLGEKLKERDQFISDTQFKLDELECEKGELKRELEDKEEILALMDQDQCVDDDDDGGGSKVSKVKRIINERDVFRLKFEKETEELKEKITYRDEQIMQLRTSLEMRKNEVQNLQSHSGDLERKLKIESERSERHLKRLDEINLELKAAEAKLGMKLEENEVLDKQVRQFRQELRAAEDKVEQMSLARKKDVDILHNKLSAARRGSTTPTSPQPYKTPTPQDEIVRLQMDIRDLKDQLIDREAELDCNRRDLEVMKRKMETRTLEVDCNNQELARRCQDLLEQNRQSEDTVKQLLMSTTEHSAQLIRATDDLKESNGKCMKLREEINELELKLEEQVKKTSLLVKDNLQLKDDNEEYKDQVDRLRQQIDSLNEQISDLCEQLDEQTQSLHKDRELLNQQLSQNDIDLAQLRSDLANSKQDLRTQKIQQQEILSERDRLKMDLEMKEKYISSRNEVIDTMRCELDDCKKTLQDYKLKVESLREDVQEETERANKEIKSQLEPLKREYLLKCEESLALKAKCDQLTKKLQESKAASEEEELKKFDEMRKKHSVELDALKLKIKDLEEELEDAKSMTLKREPSAPKKQLDTGEATTPDSKLLSGSQVTVSNGCSADGIEVGTGDGSIVKDNKMISSNGVMKQPPQQQQQARKNQTIELLNSLVIDMQRKCDDYKAQMEETIKYNIDNSRASTLKRQPPGSNGAADNLTQPPPAAIIGTATLSRPSALKNGRNKQQAQQQLYQANQSDELLVENLLKLNSIKPTRISGRPFCDICNVYDLHHTIYCPKVSEKLASHHQNQQLNQNGASNNNNNNNELDNNNFDEMLRDYDRSVQPNDPVKQFASLRRNVKIVETPPRPYCNHCDLYGHTVRNCNSLKV